MRRPHHRVAALALAALLAAAACDGEPAGAPEPDATPGEPTPARPAPTDPAREDATTPERPVAEPAPGATTPDEPAAPPPPLAEVGLTLTPVAGADQPTAGAVGPDGVLYVAERAGPVRPLTGDGLGEAVVDLTGETTVDVERGLLGIASDDQRLYVSFTDTAGDSRVDSFAWDGGGVDEASRETLLEVDQPRGNHNGGHVEIGPDGMLWFGLGDGGGSGDPFGAGQDPSTPLGAMLRLDPATGEAAPDNPFGGDAGGDPRVWAYGLRNPWRFTFDRETGDLYIADVGQHDREEVNWVPEGQGAGANFGWNLMEGTVEFAGSEPPDHWPPVHEYETGAEGCAITGGYVYRGSAVPGLAGAYLFSDYCAGGLRALRLDGGDVVDVHDFGVDGAGSVVSFAQDADGEIYLLTFGDGILRVDPA